MTCLLRHSLYEEHAAQNYQCEIQPTPKPFCDIYSASIEEGMEMYEGQMGHDQTMHCLELKGSAVSIHHTCLPGHAVHGLGERCVAFRPITLLSRKTHSTMLWYLAWCVISGQQYRIQMNFILPGERQNPCFLSISIARLWSLNQGPLRQPCPS